MRFRRLQSVLVISAICALPLGSMAQTPAGTTRATDSTVSVKADVKPLDDSDKRFLEHALQGGQGEIEGSKLAQKQSTTPEVKQFAAKMVAAHTAINHGLVALAAKKGIEAATELTLTQKVELTALNMTDRSFDTTYADRFGVKAHEKTLKLFQEAGMDAKDPDVKAFAQQHIPDLEKYLQQAKALQANVESNRQ